MNSLLGHSILQFLLSFSIAVIVFRTNRTNVSENAIVGFRTIRRPSPINGDDHENEKAGIFLIGLQARASPAERPLLRILLENLRTEFAQKAIHALVL